MICCVCLLLCCVCCVIEHLSNHFSSYDEYMAEVRSLRLEWSPVHSSDKFWVSAGGVAGGVSVTDTSCPLTLPILTSPSLPSPLPLPTLTSSPSLPSPLPPPYPHLLPSLPSPPPPPYPHLLQRENVMKMNENDYEVLRWVVVVCGGDGVVCVCVGDG